MTGIHLDQFAILSEDIKQNDMSFNVAIGFKYAEFGKKVACSINYSLMSQERKLMVLDITCEFEIHEDDWLAMKKDNRIIIPKHILEFFAVHTVGTSRGIMFCKTERTPFANIIIPPINVSEMILSDMTIDVAQSERKSSN